MIDFSLIAWVWVEIGCLFVLKQLLFPSQPLREMKFPDGRPMSYKIVALSLLVIVILWPITIRLNFNPKNKA